MVILDVRFYSNKNVQNESLATEKLFDVSNGELFLSSLNVSSDGISELFNFQRRCLPYKCIKSAVDLIKHRMKILILAGAGISVSCGIPDFRSSGGIYARLQQQYPQLTAPEDMFDFDVFKSNPRPFYSFAKEIYPDCFKPSKTHAFIRSLENKSKLLRNYTQNIDTLENMAGISNVFYCHGSFATATCMDCQRSFSGGDIRDAVMSQRIPFCPECQPEIGLRGISSSSNEQLPKTGVVKPDIVFFKENLPCNFGECIEVDRNGTDMLLVMGTSLQVYPVASIPRYIPADVPQVLINRESIDGFTFDLELIGDCDVIVQHLCNELNWNIDCKKGTSEHTLSEVDLSVPLKKALKELDVSQERKFNIAYFLPENSFTKVQERLYLFKGSEMYMSTQSAAKYLEMHRWDDDSN